MNFTMLPFTLQLDNTPLAIDLQDLTAHLAMIPDLRDPRGRRYPLALLLTVAVLAKLAGYSQLREVADWARLRQTELTNVLGFPRATLPHPTTWSRIFAHACDPAEVDHALHAFWTRPRPRAGSHFRLSLD